jgi:hypothetical protein
MDPDELLDLTELDTEDLLFAIWNTLSDSKQEQIIIMVEAELEDEDAG